MWQAACEYFSYCEDNPLIAIEWNGKDPVKFELPKMRAMTLTSLCLYLGCNTAYFRQFKANLVDKDDKESKDFATVISRIEDTCYAQKFEGAAAGLLNANIISRDLGLSEKTDSNFTGGLNNTNTHKHIFEDYAG